MDPTMRRIRCNKPVYFDVDDTLLYWAPTQQQIEEDGIDFVHTYEDGMIVEGRVVPHKVHLRQLKRHHERGHTIIIWSAGGEEWAYAPACILGLKHYGNL